MLILKILENDLHRSRNNSAVPLIVEIPARPEFLPALVSNSTGKFLVSRRLTQEGRIRVGVFPHDSDRMDELIAPMLTAALELSKAEKWGNVFDAGNVSAAFRYIKAESHLPVQPHVCIVPSSWDQGLIMKTFKLKMVEGGLAKYRKFCHVVQTDVPFVAFLSKPDMVGMYTHFLSGPAALLLHNVRRGMSFCSS